MQQKNWKYKHYKNKYHLYKDNETGFYHIVVNNKEYIVYSTWYKQWNIHQIGTNVTMCWPYQYESIVQLLEMVESEEGKIF